VHEKKVETKRKRCHEMTNTIV